MTARSLRLQERRERRGVSASAFMAEFSNAGHLAVAPAARVEENPFPPTHNPFESAARTKKAAALMAVIVKFGGNATAARKMSPVDWRMATLIAKRQEDARKTGTRPNLTVHAEEVHKVKDPSAETIAETIALLERAEAAHDS